MRFIDLDDMVEEMAGCTVSEIFASKGESAFRALEREALGRAAATPGGALIACGGGTPCQPGNMELMNSCGLTVQLTVEHSRLMNRLREGRARRPLIAALADDELEEFITAQMEKRRGKYDMATATFDSSLLENEQEIAATVEKFKQQFML